MKIEVSSESGTVTISSVTEPIIAQNVIDQVIQLKEGEPSILAGILTKNNSRSLSGTPGLAEIPILKYIFGSQQTTNDQSEVVFLLIPHIVRESVLTRLNTAAIDTGTSTNYELRRNTSFEAPGAAGAEATRNLLTPKPEFGRAGRRRPPPMRRRRWCSRWCRQASPVQPPVKPAVVAGEPR